MQPIRLAALLSLVIAGCGGNSDTSTAQPYSVLECGQSYYTSITKPKRTVITSAHEFREVYGVTDLNRQSEAPSVDFDTQQVVAVHAGTQANPAHNLRVDAVRANELGLEVFYTAFKPSDTGGCAYQAVVVYPYCFILLDKIDMPVSYNKSYEEVGC